VSTAVWVAYGDIGGASEGNTVRVEIAKSEIGGPPSDFDFLRTGRGDIGRWTVVRDASADAEVAIEQVSEDRTEDRFSLAVYKPLSLKNVAVTARLKLVSGTMQSAGFAIRVQNSTNYYVVSANALEGRVDFFRVLAGKMERIGGTDADVAVYHWHTLSLVAEGRQFTVALDKTWLFTVWDRTFPGDGLIGLWTEEDNVTRFDGLVITALPWSEEH
jgi:hypothetical protein